MSLFASASGSSVKFTNPGDTFTGQVTAQPFEKQQTIFGTQGQLAYYAPKAGQVEGDPKMQIVVPMIDQAGNEQTLYVASPRMKKAIGQAMTAAGANDISVGGVLTVTFTAFEQGKGAQPAKAFTASYQAPGAAPQQAAPAAPAAPAQSYAQAAPVGQPYGAATSDPWAAPTQQVGFAQPAYQPAPY